MEFCDVEVREKRVEVHGKHAHQVESITRLQEELCHCGGTQRSTGPETNQQLQAEYSCEQQLHPKPRRRYRTQPASFAEQALHEKPKHGQADRDGQDRREDLRMPGAIWLLQQDEDSLTHPEIRTGNVVELARVGGPATAMMMLELLQDVGLGSLLRDADRGRLRSLDVLWRHLVFAQSRVVAAHQSTVLLADSQVQHQPLRNIKVLRLWLF
mmetsp:Transcript_98468/g.264658  ORF Transcript_98468/g.264658 Transcript_98468/m.264658 type:complete len:212 (+) Transcript_98468:864-1499(+)